jgi:hypothetical protein
MIRVRSIWKPMILLGVLGLFPGLPAAEEEGPTSRPATQGELMNEKCPFTGRSADAERFVAYADEEAGVNARIYVCCGNCQGRAGSMDTAALMPTYEKAFLTARDGSRTEYGKASLIIENDRCPLTGNPASSAVTMNYNGASINLCCEGCDEGILADPDKYLHNINNDIDAAVEAAKQESEAGE